MGPLTREMFSTSPGRMQHLVSGHYGEPARIEGSVGHIGPTPQPPPAYWRVQDWFGVVNEFSPIANLIMLGNDPQGPLLPVRLDTKNLTKATT